MNNETIVIELFISIHKRLDDLNRRVTALHAAVVFLIKEEKKMSKELQDLQAQVAENTAVESSAVVLIQGIADQLAAAKDDPAAVAALCDQLNASADALAAAIAANTPTP